MKASRMKRQLRKELLLLQSEQHRQCLAQELGAFMHMGRTLANPAGVNDSATWPERAQFLLSLLLPARWRKLLVYALALRKLTQVFARTSN